MDIDDSLFTRRIIEDQENVRKRIAMDLHDSTVQSLTCLIHKVELCDLLMERDLVRARQELQTMKDDIHDIITEMREFIYELQPVSLFDLGLNAAVSKLSDNLSSSSNVFINCSLCSGDDILDSIAQVSLYRIIQEACNNAINHGHAKKILITSSFDKEYVLSLEDDGCGFNLKEDVVFAREDGHGFGLSFINERAILLGGHVDIKSKVGKGTTVVVHIPVKK